MIVENGEDSYHLEDTKKFLPPKDGLEVEKSKFSGLSKEEVLQYSTDPTWVRLRWILFALFWIIWLALLGSAVSIVIVTPGCPYRPQMNWWQQEIVYQTDVERFRDSNGDGVGDLAGVLEKIDYFKNLGVEALALKGNILAQGGMEILPKYLVNTSPKAFKKQLKMNDMHVILDLPFDMASEEVVSFWLRSFADGVRITEIPSDVEKDVLEKLIAVAEKVGDDTFEKKFIAFETFSSETGTPSTVFKSLFSKSYFATKEHKTELLANLKGHNEESLWQSYLTGTYDSDRISSVIKDKKRLEATHGIILLLKDTPFVLYGDEIELKGKNAYMKWDSSVNCGFSSNSTMGISSDCENSVRDLTAHGAAKNLIRIYKKLALLRKEPSFSWGSVQLNENADNILSFVREADGFDGYLVAANVADKKSGATDFMALHNIPKNGTVSYFYTNNELSAKEFGIGLEVSTERILLKPGELLVVKFDKRV